MTPKEKARELINGYSELIYPIINQQKAKECALYAVAKIMKLPNLGRNNNRDESEYDYWQEVRQEINNL